MSRSLQANGIPARCAGGRIVKPDSTHVRMVLRGRGRLGSTRGRSDCHRRCSADASRPGRSDMVIMHFDLIRFQRQYHWLQGIVAVVRSMTKRRATGADLEHTMTVEERSDPNEPPRASPSRTSPRNVEPESRGAWSGESQARHSSGVAPIAAGCHVAFALKVKPQRVERHAHCVFDLRSSNETPFSCLRTN